MRRLSRLSAAGLALVIGLMSGTPGAVAADYPRPTADEWWFIAWQVDNKIWPLTHGSGVTVAVLDTGVQADIPDLHGVVVPGTNESDGPGDGTVDHDDAPVPGHGTGMATLIASQGTSTGFVGIAPEAKILPIDVKSVDDEALSKSIRYAADHGAKVINVSQGVARVCPDTVQRAVIYALQKDAVVVAAAGNSGDATYVKNPSDEPANCAGVLAVGAIDNQLQPWVSTERQPYVKIAAPGVNVGAVIKDGKFHTAQGGTSGASALTSGALALIRSKFPDMSARDAVQRLFGTIRPIGNSPHDNATGYGAIRPYYAIVNNVPKSAPNPVFDEYDKWLAAHPDAAAKPSAGSSSAASKSDSSGPSAIVIVAIVVGALGAVILLAFLASRGRRRPQPAAVHPGFPQQPGAQADPYRQQGPPSFGAPPNYGPPQGAPQQPQQSPPDAGPRY